MLQRFANAKKKTKNDNREQPENQLNDGFRTDSKIFLFIFNYGFLERVWTFQLAKLKLCIHNIFYLSVD